MKYHCALNMQPSSVFLFWSTLVGLNRVAGIQVGSSLYSN